MEKRKQRKDLQRMCDTFIPDSDVGPDSDKSETATILVSDLKGKLDAVEIDSEPNMSLKIPQNQHRVIVL